VVNGRADVSRNTRRHTLPLQLQFFFHAQGKIFRPSRRGDDAVGNGLLQFGAGGAGFLREREVFFQSGGAPDRHGTADPDQFTGLDIEHLFVFIVENFLPYPHRCGLLSDKFISPDGKVTEYRLTPAAVQ
jgi:hypothetical protein